MFWPYLNNKYVIVLFLFLIWFLFVSDHDLFFVFKSCRIEQELQVQKIALAQQIIQQEQELWRLQNDTAYLEKYARERYYFKQPNEVIFIDSFSK